MELTRVAAFGVAIALLACSSKSETTQTPAADTGVLDTGSADASPSYNFADLDSYLYGGGYKTEGALVMHRGRIVYERYAPGWNENKRHITYSVSKSIGSALIGIAINDGLMKLNESICVYVAKPDAAEATFCEMTIENLLHMSSGLKWEEGYEANPETSDVLQMLYGLEDDMGAYVANRPRAARPGTAWKYSSGDANLLAKALRVALKGKDSRSYAKEKLFDPAGMTSAIFETDRSGTLVFSSSAFMTPRDMGKFGQLYLDGGRVGMTQVLPSNWVSYTSAAAPAASTPQPRDPAQPLGSTGGSYGAAFWLNATSPLAPAETWKWPAVPVEAFSAEGHWGQFIYIVPSRSLVVVRVGNDRTPGFNEGPMVEKAVVAVDAATNGGGK